MTDGRGRWITYNGEIFNYLELRSELEAAGKQFRTNSDTEVILQIYDAYGEAGFAKLNGMWAFALADIPGRPRGAEPRPLFHEAAIPTRGGRPIVLRQRN